MLVIVPKDRAITVYDSINYNPMHVGDYEIRYDYGKAIRNIYLVNNIRGNFVVYRFNDSGKPDFDLLCKTTDGTQILGAENFIHDAYHSGGSIFILVEKGSIYKLNPETLDCEIVEEIDIISNCQDDEREFCFYYDEEDQTFVVSNNARLVYPNLVEYPINLEKPVFVFPGVIASSLTKSAIDLSTGKQYSLIDVVEAATHGAMFGWKTKQKDKKFFIMRNNIKEIADKFNGISQIADNIFAAWSLTGDNMIQVPRIIRNDAIESSDNSGPDKADGQGNDAILSQF
jgi:hypothetical protein